MSDDTANWIMWSASAITGVSAIIAMLSRRDSKRSADSAEKSAYEAKMARKIAQTDILSEHFDNAAYLWAPILGTTGRDEQKITLGKRGVETLKVFLSHDVDFLPTLNWMNTIIDQVPDGVLEYYSQLAGNVPSYQTPENAAALKEHFETKRREYLNIG